jgi:aldose 1-epimerase
MVKLEKGELEAEIVNEGAYLVDLRKDGEEVLLHGNLERKTRGGMALLIPFANRVKGGSYIFEGKVYDLPRNSEGNAIHGLAKDLRWDVEASSRDEVTFKVKIQNQGYPSALSCRVTYEIGCNSLQVEMEIFNEGNSNAPLTVGAHPYFVANKWRIEPSKMEMLESVNKIPTGRTITVDVNSINSLDDCFLFEGKVVLTADKHRITLSSKDMKFLQIYTGIPNSIAIEPMSGAPDAYHNGIGLKVLKVGENARYSFSLLLEKAYEQRESS